MAQKLMPRLDFPAGHRGGPSRPIIAKDLDEIAQRLLHDPALCASDRVASVLIAVFAQPVSRVARLTADDVAIEEENVAIRFGDTAVSMPAPVASDVRRLLGDVAERSAAMVRHPLWLFPSHEPGRPIGEQALSRRMKAIGVECNGARRAALLQLAGRVPAAIVADLLGVHVSTATQWAQMSGRPWGDIGAASLRSTQG